MRYCLSNTTCYCFALLVFDVAACATVVGARGCFSRQGEGSQFNNLRTLETRLKKEPAMLNFMNFQELSFPYFSELHFAFTPSYNT
jgi:hypothetical protein